MVDIIIIRSANSIIYDPRVKKIVVSLRKRYSVIALGWNRDGISQEKINDYPVKAELFKLRTSTWSPSLTRILIRLFVFFPPFWIWVFFKLLRHRPEVVHTCDMDTFPPAFIYKLLFRKKLVFEVFDRYAMALIPQKFKKLNCVINYFEELFSEHSDALIIAGGEKVLNTFHSKPKFVEVLLNCPHDYFERNTNQNANNENRDFRLVYTGGIRKDRALESVAQTILNLDMVSFLVAGPIIDPEVLEKIQKSDRVKYYGILDPKDALYLEARSHTLLALYNPQIFWNNITLPNKLFEAMMCGIPIITNIAPEIVSEIRCGLIVNYDNVEQIKDAITSLRDKPDLRNELGNNGRKAFLEKYNWNIMEQRLYNLYKNLLVK